MDPLSPELLPLPVLAIDAGDRIVSLNPAAAALFGLPPTDAVGQSALLLVPPDAIPDYHRAAEAARRNRRWVGELRILTAYGGERLAEVAWGCDDGQFVVALTDVSERQAAAERQQQTAAGAAARAISAGIAAELARPAADPMAVSAQLRRLADGPHPDDAVFRGSGQWVLLAADGPLLAAGLRVLLESAGYCVVTADRRTVAHEFRRQRGRTPVVVFDLGTANLSAANDLWMVNPQLPVIAVEPERGLAHWPTGRDARHLRRPVDPAELLAAVAEAFVEATLYDSAVG